ncbi:hypothetical protein CR513_03340, partial [Mucuna pruriens]
MMNPNRNNWSRLLEDALWANDHLVVSFMQNTKYMWNADSNWIEPVLVVDSISDLDWCHTDTLDLD